MQDFVNGSSHQDRTRDASLAWAAVPLELRRLPQWVNWREEIDKDGKKKKVPYNPNRGPRAQRLRYASVTKPNTWGSFEQVIENARRDPSYGIGFVFCDDPYVGMDFDGCIDPATGEISPWACELLDAIGTSYAEISPSGTGLKIWVRDDGTLEDPIKWQLDRKLCPPIPGIEKTPGIEIYTFRRYFTVTGNVMSGCESIARPTQCLKEIVEIARTFLAAPKPPSEEKMEKSLPESAYRRMLESASAACFPGTDAELITQACAEDGTFESLFKHGSLAAYGDDHSRADQALLRRLAFRCGPDPERIERLFDESALVRDKWFERKDYRARSIRKAIEHCEAVFKYGSMLDVVVGDANLIAANGGKAADASADAPGVEFISMADLMDADLPELGWVIEPYLPKQLVTLFSGHGDIGKRYLALVLAAHVAAGRDFG